MRDKLTPRQAEQLWLYQRLYIGANKEYQKLRQLACEQEKSRDAKIFRIALGATCLPPFPLGGKPNIVQKNLMLKGYIVLSCQSDTAGRDFWVVDLTEKGRTWER